MSEHWQGRLKNMKEIDGIEFTYEELKEINSAAKANKLTKTELRILVVLFANTVNLIVRVLVGWPPRSLEDFARRL